MHPYRKQNLHFLHCPKFLLCSCQQKPTQTHFRTYSHFRQRIETNSPFVSFIEEEAEIKYTIACEGRFLTGGYMMYV